MKDEGKDSVFGWLCRTRGDCKQHKMQNPIIIEKGYRNRPLTKEQKSDNSGKNPRHVVFVEHVFGFEEQTMRGLVVQ